LHHLVSPIYSLSLLTNVTFYSFHNFIQCFVKLMECTPPCITPVSLHLECCVSIFTCHPRTYVVVTSTFEIMWSLSVCNVQQLNQFVRKLSHIQVECNCIRLLCFHIIFVIILDELQKFVIWRKQNTFHYMRLIFFDVHCLFTFTFHNEPIFTGCHYLYNQYKVMLFKRTSLFY
jgi:hypothetical protein